MPGFSRNESLRLPPTKIGVAPSTLAPSAIVTSCSMGEAFVNVTVTLPAFALSCFASKASCPLVLAASASWLAAAGEADDEEEPGAGAEEPGAAGAEAGATAWLVLDDGTVIDDSRQVVQWAKANPA